MMRLIHTFVFALITVASLALLPACSAEQDSPDSTLPTSAETPVTSEQSPSATADNNSFEQFDTGYSTKTLMNAIVQPNALEIWRAVRYVSTIDGVIEDVAPQTDEDWENLRTSAITLVEAGNALLIPGRVTEAADPEVEYPAYMYTSEEIQTRLEANPELWRTYIQEMQFFTQATLESIERRDVLGLIEKGAVINNACQGCHAEFWYRRDIQ
jgi:hypothetical protein